MFNMIKIGALVLGGVYLVKKVFVAVKTKPVQISDEKNPKRQLDERTEKLQEVQGRTSVKNVVLENAGLDSSTTEKKNMLLEKLRHEENPVVNETNETKEAI